ncbi:hypothetical protein GCM10009716_33190 [Streptomyces sodiiphilus]|uniref:Peptidase n=2 Tax=Streptomyces sodiiphilus TaxID=226217 RepID=A0ABN2PJ77_9ACTN
MAALTGAAALLLLAPAAALADGEEPVAEPQPYRMADDAEPIEGTERSSDAPRLEGGGTYTDEIAPGQTLYYSIGLDDVSDVYLTTVAAPAPGTKVGYSDRIEVVLQTTGGDTCLSSDRQNFGADGLARPITAWSLRAIDPDRSCQEAGVYHYTVTRDSDPTSSPEPWPLELRVLVEPPVTGGQVNPPSPGSVLTEPPAPPADAAERVTGGTGFNDARPVTEGVWRDDIAPGQTLFYRIPVDWSQQLALTVELGNTAAKDDASWVSDGLTAALYNPARARLGEEKTSYRGEAEEMRAITPPVAYDNRYDDLPVSRMRFAGWHYIAVTLHEDVATVTDEPSIGLTLRTSLEGEVTAGPDYEDPQAALDAGFGVRDSDRDQAEKGLSDQEIAADRRGSQQLLGFAGIGAGVGLLAALTVWQLTARRRAAASQPAPPPGGPWAA